MLRISALRCSSPALRSIGSPSRVPRMIERRFTASCMSRNLVWISAIGAPIPTPGVVDQHVEAPEAGLVRGEDAFQLRLVGDVRGDGLDLVAGLAQVRDRVLQFLRPARRKRQPVPLVRQHLRDRQADPTGRPRDQCRSLRHPSSLQSTTRAAYLSENMAPMRALRFAPGLVCLLACGSLVLAGCGGGSSSSSHVNQERRERQEPPGAAEERLPGDRRALAGRTRQRRSESSADREDRRPSRSLLSRDRALPVPGHRESHRRKGRQGGDRRRSGALLRRGAKSETGRGRKPGNGLPSARSRRGSNRWRRNRNSRARRPPKTPTSRASSTRPRSPSRAKANTRSSR